MSALKAIHVGLKQLGIENDDARDLYERMTGKRSLRVMQPKEHEAVIGELRRMGFKAVPGGARRRKLEGRYAGKLQALWIAAWNLGLVRHRDDQALVAFAKRQTGIDHVRFLQHGQDANRVIEALKGWMAREAGVDWHTGDEMPYWQRRPGYRIARAQWLILRTAGALPEEGGIAQFSQFVSSIAGKTIPSMTDADWRAVMNALGGRVRKARGTGK